jgi:hypothetical protein
MVLHTLEYRITDQTEYIDSQPGVVSVVTLAESVTTPGWLKLANDAFYLIGSAVFQSMEYH